jgi:hypothetical protein
MDNAADLPKPIDEAIAHDAPKRDRASYEAEKAKVIHRDDHILGKALHPDTRHVKNGA